MELSTVQCHESLAQLRFDSAGQHAPSSDQAIIARMCDKYCLWNNMLRDEPMSTSQCTCMELSTKSNNLHHRFLGNWCYTNSGHILCNELERCDVWQ